MPEAERALLIACGFDPPHQNRRALSFHAGARHNKMDADQFRAYVERESKVERQAGIRPFRLALP